jgi:transcription factor S
MQFCPKCGNLLLPKEGGKKTNLVCGKCGYVSREKKNIILKEKVVLTREEKIEVIDQKIETLPKVHAECKKCGHKKAFFWLVQTRSSDEAETKFYECVKCGHRWREYS